MLVLVALGMGVEIGLVGRLFLSEIFLAAALPFALYFRTANRFDREWSLTTQFYILAGLWFLGAVVTDAVRETPFEDLARGWSKILFLILNFASILLLVDGSRQRAVSLVVLLSAASAVRLRMGLNLYVPDAESVFGNPWKFGYGQLAAEGAFLLSAILISYPLTRLAGLSLPFVDASINLALNARNLFGLTALSALVVAFLRSRRRALSPAFLAAMAIVAAAAASGLVFAYSYVASSGMIGLEAKDKYEAQSSGGLGILLGGRTESIASTQAILDSPILGHGSWARDVQYVALMANRMEEAGYDAASGDPLADDLIPTHSHLLGAWVESGVLGAIFWLWVGWATIRGLHAAVSRPTPMTGFIVFIGLSLLWDIFFSPFSSERRVIVPAWLILMILTAEDREGKALADRRKA